MGAADADCMILIEYYSELLNHVSENLVLDFNYSRYIFVVPGDPNFLARDLVNLNYTLSISYSPRPPNIYEMSKTWNLFYILVRVRVRWDRQGSLRNHHVNNLFPWIFKTYFLF